jgi:hypothetical protein
MRAPGGECVYCGCTAAAPCEPRCRWTNARAIVCGRCVDGERVAEVLTDCADRVRGGSARPWRSRPFDERRGFVLAVAAVLDAVLEGAREVLDGHVMED